MSTTKISAVLVIFNEEVIIERCLQSFCDIVDEIIIVHDGECSDKSLEICSKYTDKLFIRKHAGEAEPHRVFGMKETKNNRILQIDADEIVSNGMAEFLKNFQPEYNICAYEFEWVMNYKGKERFGDYKRCFFDKDIISYIGAPHEYVKPLNKKFLIKRSHETLFHKPNYNNLTFKTFMRKQKKWAKIHAQYFVKDFAEIPKWNYKDSSWPKREKIFLTFPVLGMLYRILGCLISGIIKSIKSRDMFFFLGGMQLSIYYFFVYYFYSVLIFKNHIHVLSRLSNKF